MRSQPKRTVAVTIERAHSVAYSDMVVALGVIRDQGLGYYSPQLSNRAISTEARAAIGRIVGLSKPKNLTDNGFHLSLTAEDWGQLSGLVLLISQLLPQTKDARLVKDKTSLARIIAAMTYPLVRDTEAFRSELSNFGQPSATKPSSSNNEAPEQQSAVQRTQAMPDWEKITGPTAIELAERGNIARPGTFSAVAIKWMGGGKAPFLVKIAGTLRCGYCGKTSQFTIEGMSGQTPCDGCGSTYNLFNTDREIDGQDGRIMAASVYSHRQGTAIVLPQVDIVDVRSVERSAAEEEKPRPSVLSVWDCGDRSKIKAFIDAGGDINMRDDDQWTLLHRAAFMDLAGYVRNLIDVGADPNLPVLPGGSKRTVDIVRSNHKENAGQIEAMLTGGKK